MKFKNTLVLSSALALSVAVSGAWAKVSDAEAARLGADLTPMGAEKAGNGGDIPEWTGGLKEAPAGFDGVNYVNPYEGDALKFTIDASNVAQYADKLSPGQQAMIAKYPTYKIPVYETRRSATYPDELYGELKKNATNTELVDGGNGLSNFVQGIPFPVIDPADPEAGIKAIWNHIVRYRGGSVTRTVNQATPQQNGAYTLVKFKDEFTFRSHLKGADLSQPSNILFYFKQQVLAPARLAGNVLLVHETLDQVKEPRLAWLYNAGQRRVRRAPQVAYDGPGTASDGLRTSDNFDMYNGAPDRYDWKLVGKKEMYLPYNSYKLKSKSLKYDDILMAGHINQDHARYELHRVWEVEATLKEGQRHIYGKRVFYIDEDSWQATVIDHYDGRGELWRVAEAHNLQFYDRQLPWYAIEALYDLLAGRYIVIGMDNEEAGTYDFGFERSEKDYTPAALRRSGRR
jgi:hypothetical protein